MKSNRSLIIFTKTGNTNNLKPLKIWQKFILLGFSFGLIVLIEIILRICGIGGHPTLFIPVMKDSSGKQIYVSNPAAQSIFFMAHAKGQERESGGLITQRILVPKPKDELRVFVVGESTIQGFPYPKTLCSPAFLAVMLQQALPNKRVDVINLGVTAAASYPVWKITEQALAYEPDLIIVYAGHNEYFGAFGVASLQSVGTLEWEMNAIYLFRGLGLYQGMIKLMELFSKHSTQRKDLIEIMAKTNSIPVDDSLRQSAQKNLLRHLQLIVESSKKRNVPVILCTLVSNERDVAPIRSADAKSLTQEKAKQWQNNFELGMKYLQQNKADAVQCLKTASQVFPNHALTHYRYAQALDIYGDTTFLLWEYQRAKDLDEMPWRAAETTNDLIRDLAKKENVWLADVETQFHQLEPVGIGWRLMVDHLHPSIEGQVLLARTIYDTLKSHQWASLDNSTSAVQSDWKELATLQGYSKYKEYEVAVNVAGLWEKPPMDANNELARDYYQKVAYSIATGFTPIEKIAVQRWHADLHNHPYPPDLTMYVGDAYYERGMLSEAQPYFQRALNQGKDFTLYNLHLAMNLLFCSKMTHKTLTEAEKKMARDKLLEGEAIKKFGLEKGQRGDFYRIRGGLHQILDEHEQAIADFKIALQEYKGRYRQQIAINLAQSYLALHKIEEARRILEQERLTSNWDGPTRMLKSIESGSVPL